jgi:hypothetical protein
LLLLPCFRPVAPETTEGNLGVGGGGHMFIFYPVLPKKLVGRGGGGGILLFHALKKHLKVI